VTFGERLSAVFADRGQLCVGIDPHESLLVEWGLAGATGARDFGLRVVEAAAGRAGIVKPQVAFYERFGAAGISALEEVLAAARAAGLLVIADAKRGDIGSTMAGYAAAWTGEGPLAADAVTVSPYLGSASLAETNTTARAAGAGLFLLAATSNPEAAELQTARTASGATVAATIVERVREWNTGETLGSTGVVIGATVDLDALGLDRESLVGVPILAPGFGAQGARYADVRDLFGPATGGVLLSASRSILAAGPVDIASAIATQAAEVAEAVAA